jgi:hypothetical protein
MISVSLCDPAVLVCLSDERFQTSSPLHLQTLPIDTQRTVVTDHDDAIQHRRVVRTRMHMLVHMPHETS